jgi:hypothetical protein
MVKEACDHVSLCMMGNFPMSGSTSSSLLLAALYSASLVIIRNSILNSNFQVARESWILKLQTHLEESADRVPVSLLLVGSKWEK